MCFLFHICFKFQISFFKVLIYRWISVIKRFYVAMIVAVELKKITLRKRDAKRFIYREMPTLLREKNKKIVLFEFDSLFILPFTVWIKERRILTRNHFDWRIMWMKKKTMYTTRHRKCVNVNRKKLVKWSKRREAKNGNGLFKCEQQPLQLQHTKGVNKL